MASPVVCAGCGARMNHHGDKLIDPSGPEDVALVDPALGGIVEEAHSCPACGESTTRRRAPDRRPQRPVVGPLQGAART